MRKNELKIAPIFLSAKYMTTSLTLSLLVHDVSDVCGMSEIDSSHTHFLFFFYLFVIYLFIYLHYYLGPLNPAFTEYKN